MLPKDEVYACHICRSETDREDIEKVHMTEEQRWDELLAVAQAWGAFDHRPEVDTSEEEREEAFDGDIGGSETTCVYQPCNFF